MTSKSADNILEELKATLGEEFGIAFYCAHNEWCDLWVTWKQFENLFGHGPERVELLNRAGASFFYRVDRLFFEAVALAVCRLSDPTKTAGKSNLTVKLFEQYMDTDDRVGQLAELLERVDATTEFARDWRNRHIGHNDLILKTGPTIPLATATRESMNAAIEALHAVFAYVRLEFLGQNLHNEVIDDLNNEMVMLHRLYLGDEQFQSEIKNSKAGDQEIRKLPNWLSPN